MPELGEIRKASETGHKGKDKYIWHACENCGEERWVHLANSQPRHKLCPSCWMKRHTKYSANSLKPSWEGGSRNPNWKGGRVREGGYIKVCVEPDDFFFPMTQVSKRRWGGYVLEHRLVMARHLSRCLLPWEVVHHKNGIKDDNRIENLQLLPDGKYHLSDNLLKANILRLGKRIDKLQKENKKLKQTLTEVT